MKSEIITLKNKIETLFINAPGSTSACVQIWFRAGSALEEGKDKGIAHFLEHMFFKGTKKRSGKQLAKSIESIGGELNAFTSFDYTCYYNTIPNTNLLTGINTILEMVSSPEFKEKDIKPETNVVLEEFKKSLDGPSQYSFFQLQKNVFSKGYNHPILGVEKTIKHFNRKQLVSFRNKFYNNSNALLIIAGDLGNKKKLIKAIENYKIPTGEKISFPKFKLKSSSIINIHHKDVRMSNLTITIKAPEFDDSNAAVEDIAFNCLGHGETSRLYKELVLQTSYANSASSSTMFFAKGGMHLIQISFPHKNFSKILSILKNILVSACRKGFNYQEIDRIKNQYSSSKIYEMESIEAYSFSLGHSFAQTGNINSEHDFIDKIKKCSIEDINKSLNDIFKNSLHFILQIPKNKSICKSKTALANFKDSLATQLQQKTIISKKKNNQYSKFDPQIKKITLRSGITLLYRQNNLTPTFVFHSYLKGGLVYEKKSTAGTHNILSALLPKGFGKRKYEEIKHDLEIRSASLQNFSGKNSYGITMHGQSEHHKELMNIFFGSLLNASFPQNFLEHEKEMILRSLENQKEDPVRQCFQKVSEMIFNDHPYSYNILGYPESIKQVTQKSIIDIHHNNLINSNILFTYCGNLELHQVKNTIESYIANLGPRTTNKYCSKKFNSIIKDNIYIPFDREQSHLFIGFPVGKMDTSENIDLALITTILSGQTSQLFLEVRDKLGLCYIIQPVHFSALDGGYWGIYMACSPNKVKQSQKKINEILTNFNKNGISKNEFIKAQKMIKGQSLLSVQTNEDFANIYSIPFFFGLGIDHYHIKNMKIDNLEYNSFQKRIKKIFAKKKLFISTGNH